MAPKTETKSLDAPPLDPDNMDYEKWRKKSTLWFRIAKIPKKDKGVKFI